MPSRALSTERSRRSRKLVWIRDLASYALVSLKTRGDFLERRPIIRKITVLDTEPSRPTLSEVAAKESGRLLVLLYFTFLATRMNAGRLFLGWWLGGPSSQTTITAGGTLTW